ncbi:4Fe-4S binding protein [bacterium]|nr:4Fe-4S binding protein [bacterium]
MKYPKLRELREAIIALIKGPCTTKYPFEPHKPFDRFRGKPIPNSDECIGCEACASVCPAKAIEIINDVENLSRRIVWSYDKCIFCGQCEANCTTETGVKLSNEEFDLAVFDRSTLRSEVEKELVICFCCNEIIGTKEQLLWLARKLGPLAYGNFPLILATQNELQIVKDDKYKVNEKPGRSNIFNILCPRCRHKVELVDQYGK